MSKGLISFSISNFRGIVALEAAPNGKSVTLKGKNGAGKSSAIDALWWALGGAPDGEVVRNGADVAEVELRFDDYLIRRRQKRGGKPTLEVRSADGKAKFQSPTALLSGFVGAVERRTFSSKSAKDRAAVLRQLAPGLDCADLDAERAKVFAERTDVNRDAKTFRAQAEGVEVPAAPTEIGEERPIVDVVDVAAIAEKKAGAAEAKAKNDSARAAAHKAADDAASASNAVADARAAVAEAERALAAARRKLGQEEQRHADLAEIAATLLESAALLVDPDTSAIDAEIAAARQKNAAARAEAESHNKAVRARQTAADEARRARAERERLEKQAAAKEAESAKLTARLDAIDAEKAARLAGAKLPIAGIAMAGDVVTFDDGKAGAVELEALNTASRIRLDIAIAAALGHRLIAVREASLLDGEQRAEIDRFALQRGVQLLAEVVVSGAPLSAVIEEADAAVLDAVVLQEEFQL